MPAIVMRGSDEVVIGFKSGEGEEEESEEDEESTDGDGGLSFGEDMSGICAFEEGVNGGRFEW